MLAARNEENKGKDLCDEALNPPVRERTRSIPRRNKDYKLEI